MSPPDRGDRGAVQESPPPPPVGGGHSTAWLDQWPGVRVREPLARHSQYGIGGPADWFLPIQDTGILPDLLSRCQEAGVPVAVLGAGSNALLLDGGVRGLVIRLTDKRWRAIDATTVELSGGCMMPRVALDLAKQGLAGLEFGIGIPGTCGASVWGNAGAFGREISDVLVSCETVAPGCGRRRFSRDECGFGYRHSRFKADLTGHVVVAARFRISSDDPVATRQRTEAIQARRKATQPFGAKARSLGSVFKNPPGDHAGRLVEAAGLKGCRVGGAEIAAKHANFITNVERATAADVLSLVELAQGEVLRQFGIRLEREIVVMGEAAS